jgi:hypothetical protein
MKDLKKILSIKILIDLKNVLRKYSRKNHQNIMYNVLNMICSKYLNIICNI